jgi:hypothetical protein
MPKYVLGHYLKGEGAPLDLMSELLDPMPWRYIDALGRCKLWSTYTRSWMWQRIDFCLARRTSESGGTAVAIDLDPITDHSLQGRFIVGGLLD